jgi:hypothetical protein
MLVSRVTFNGNQSCSFEDETYGQRVSENYIPYCPPTMTVRVNYEGVPMCTVQI